MGGPARRGQETEKENIGEADRKVDFSIYTFMTVMNPDELLRFLIEQGSLWVQTQRDRHRPASRALTAPERAVFGPFFGEQVLDVGRVRYVPVIENPGFYADLRALGVPPPIDFREMEGITFVDTVLVSGRHHPHDPPLPALLFHELVHVVQYSLLGRGRFIERYVHGWAQNGQNYFRIPMGENAYALQAQYERNPRLAFSVETEVRRQLEL